MAEVQNVFRGTEAIAAADGASIVVPLPQTINAAHSFVSFTSRTTSGTQRVLRHAFNASLSDTQITFTRNSGASAASHTIEWEVVEFDSSVAVQRGEVLHAGTQTDVTLSPSVELDDSWPLPAFETNNNELTGRATPAISLVNGGATLRIETGFTAAGDDCTVGWQVISFAGADASVQHGTAFMASGASSATYTLPVAVTRANSFIVHCGAIAGVYGTAWSSRYTCTTELTNDTTVTVTKTEAGTDPSLDVHFCVVEMLDGSTVEHISTQIPSGSTTPTVQPTFAAMTNPALAVGMPTLFASQIPGQRPGSNYLATVAVNPTKDGVTIQREGTLDDLDIRTCVIDWNEGGVGPTPITGTIAQDLQPIDQDLAGTLTIPGITGTIAQDLQPIDQDLVATYTPTAVSGSIAQDLQPVDQDLSGTYTPLAISGTITQDLRPIDQQLVGVYAAGITGFIAQDLQPINHDYLAVYTPNAVTGTIDQDLQPVDQDLVATYTQEGITGAIAQTLEPVDQDLAATYTPQAISGTIAQELQPIDQQLVGSIDAGIMGFIAQDLQPVTQDLAATYTPVSITGAIDQTLQPITQDLLGGVGQTLNTLTLTSALELNAGDRVEFRGFSRTAGTCEVIDSGTILLVERAVGAPIGVPLSQQDLDDHIGETVPVDDPHGAATADAAIQSNLDSHVTQAYPTNNPHGLATLAAEKVSKTGDTMSGALEISHDGGNDVFGLTVKSDTPSGEFVNLINDAGNRAAQMRQIADGSGAFEIYPGGGGAANHVLLGSDTDPFAVVGGFINDRTAGAVLTVVGNADVDGELSEQGQRVYGPNNESPVTTAHIADQYPTNDPHNIAQAETNAKVYTDGEIAAHEALENPHPAYVTAGHAGMYLAAPATSIFTIGATPIKIVGFDTAQSNPTDASVNLVDSSFQIAETGLWHISILAVFTLIPNSANNSPAIVMYLADSAGTVPILRLDAVPVPRFGDVLTLKGSMTFPVSNAGVNQPFSFWMLCDNGLSVDVSDVETLEFATFRVSNFALNPAGRGGS